MDRIVICTFFLAISCQLSLAGYQYQFNGETKTFEAAEEYCQTFGGHLASPRTEEERLNFENELKASLLNGDDIWIGGKAVDDFQGGWGLRSSGKEKGTRLWRWVSPTGNNFLQGQGCYKDDWSSELGYEITGLSSVTVPNCIEECQGRGRRYAALKEGKYCHCINEFGLKGPISTNVNNGGGDCDKKCTADQDTYYYCGGHDDTVYNLYMVGGADSIWYRNTPNNDAGVNQQCATIIRKWNDEVYWKLDDLECYEERPFICTGMTSTTCDSNGGKYYGSKYCILRGAYEKTWFEARNHCMDMGGDLLVYETEIEFTDLSNILLTLDSEIEKDYWVGAIANDFIWATGEYITYTNWATNYPRNFENGPKCIIMSDILDWKDTDCSSSHTFACQYDDDECQNNPCGSKGTCVNKPGRYECDCVDGYSFDGTTCSDTNECAASTNPCGDNSVCNNNVGGYTCSCSSGYVSNGQTCIAAVNECTNGQSNCDVNAFCTDQDVGFTCTCNAGYSGDGVTCTDTQECSSPNLNICDEHANCINTIGGYECECISGYTGNGVTCKDVDECENGLANCYENADCFNTAGSFYCQCTNGYADTGTSCADIDECTSPSTNNCNENADCTNIAGSFRCRCQSGYTGDGINCTEVGGSGGATGNSTAPIISTTLDGDNQNGNEGATTKSSTTKTSTTSTTTTTSTPSTTTTNPPSDTGTSSAGTGGNAGASAGASTNNDGSGLATAEIILIILCVLLVIVIIALIAFICYYKRKNKAKTRVRSESTNYDARNEAPVPYTGHLGDDYYNNYYSGSESGSTTGLVPAKNSRASQQHQGNHYNNYGNRKITLDEKY